MILSRNEAAKAFAEHPQICWSYGIGPRNLPGFWFVDGQGEAFHAEVPEDDASLVEKLAFVGRVALATFPHEDKVFHYGWVHGVLENCTEDARVKYDVCFAALLAALAALETR